jgi:hypothetical protein
VVHNWFEPVHDASGNYEFIMHGLFEPVRNLCSKIREYFKPMHKKCENFEPMRTTTTTTTPIGSHCFLLSNH